MGTSKDVPIVFLSIVLLIAQMTSPSPTSIAHCADAYSEAKPTRVVSPVYPAAARNLKLGPVTVLVQIKLDATGALTEASIYKSSGNSDLDKAAMDAARASRYIPKIVNCTAVPSTYIWHANFAGYGSVTPIGVSPSPWPSPPPMSPPEGWHRILLADRMRATFESGEGALVTIMATPQLASVPNKPTDGLKKIAICSGRGNEVVQVIDAPHMGGTWIQENRMAFVGDAAYAIVYRRPRGSDEKRMEEFLDSYCPSKP